MKRILMGFIWFVVLYIGTLAFIGGIIGGISASGSGAKNYHEGAQVGHAAGEEFGKKYGGLLFLLSIGAAGLGTFTGILPGTKRKSPASDQATAGSETKETGPTGPSHWGFWGTIIWSALILAIFISVQIVTMTVAITLSEGPLPEAEIRQKLVPATETGNALALLTAVTTFVCLGLIVAIIKLKEGALLREYLCLRPVSLEKTLRWFWFAAGLLVLSDLTTHMLGRPIVPEFMSTAYRTANPILPLWLAVIVAAPLFEETFFRGFLFKGVETSFLRPIGAVVVSAALWAAIHVQYDLYGMATIFIFGLLLGAARVATGSLLVPLGMHSIGNLVATIEAAIWG